MNHIATQRRQSLTASQTREIRAELARESRRLSPDDPRAPAVVAALQRIELGTYGYCATCGDSISPERLFVLPETIYCFSCRRDHS
jgi:RNA polymerase-binding transcription factor DksA